MDHGARPGVHALCIQKKPSGCWHFCSFLPGPEILISKMATKKFIHKWHLEWQQKKTVDNHKRSCNNYQHLTETQVCSNTWRIHWFQGDCKKVNCPSSAAHSQYKEIHIMQRNYKLTVIQTTVILIFFHWTIKSSVLSKSHLKVRSFILLCFP